VRECLSRTVTPMRVQAGVRLLTHTPTREPLVTAQEKFEHALMILGACVPLLSAMASLLNHIVRLRVAANQLVSPLLSGASTVLNLSAVNIDKAVQMGRMFLDEKKVGAPVPSAPVPLGADAPTKTDPMGTQPK